MSPKKKRSDPERLNQIVADARREREQREKGYRGQALKLFPPICAHCGREFSGQRLRELTVHHKDNNHHNNPPDGSNWELLCIYCHDYEHASYTNNDVYSTQMPGYEQKSYLTHKPFANLKSLLEEKEQGDISELNK